MDNEVTEMAAGRERLLQCAETLFAERGYSAVSIRDIAQATGLSHGAIYHHFSGKEDLYCQMIEDNMGRMTDALRHAAKRQGNETIRERMARSCRAYVELSAQKRELFEHLLRDLAQLEDKRAQELIPRVKNALADIFEEILGEGIARNEIGQVDARTAAVAFLGMMNVVFSPQFGDKDTSEYRLQFVIDLFFDGIVARR